MTDRRKVAIVTGAGSGIGKACALRFTRAGVRTVITDINSDALQAVSEKITEQGGDSLCIVADVSDTSACEQVTQQVLSAWGHIDILVANAGVQIRGSLLEADERDWDRILAVNLKGVAYSCKAVIPAMLKQGSGSIVIISSVNALVGSVGMAIYDMSKAGVLALTRSLATECGPHGVRVNAVCPGNTLTEFHIDKMNKEGVSIEQIHAMTKGYGLLGRIAEPGEIANAVHFLASEQASFVTGHTLVVDGGFSITGRAS
jgi:meso-butanediol dehydrogenase/(S,S)-butanediol dehydrogenase/diacetyl reductase